MDDKNLSRLYKTLSDENRRLILWFLSKRDLCVCEFEQLLTIKQSTISIHLKTLADQNLVNSYKEGRWIIYQPQPMVCKETHRILDITFAIMDNDQGYNPLLNKLSKVTRNSLCNMN